LTRFTWPRAIFISNVKSAYIVSKEAISSKIPIIALIDTNVKNFFYNLPIGSNDDSIDSIGFMNNIITQYIIKSKYKKILL
jgi:ribosomal protein S2